MAIQINKSNLQPLPSTNKEKIQPKEMQLKQSAKPETKATWRNGSTRQITLVLKNGDKITLQPGERYSGSGNTGVIAFY